MTEILVSAKPNVFGWVLVWTSVNCYLGQLANGKHPSATPPPLVLEPAYAWVVEQRADQGRVTSIRRALPLELFRTVKRVTIYNPISMIALSDFEDEEEAVAILRAAEGAEQLRAQTGKPMQGAPRIVMPGGPLPKV